ncbi:hypothetical protein KAR91_38045 [Candidatus Pacearchaeota archaeon]|nr:hypothetical protein [Candidatus Pacearchaeota archaeon]
MNLWRELIEYVNKKPLGIVITRKELIKYFSGEFLGRSPSISIDTYRNLLTQIGSLKSVGVGKYKIMNHLKPKFSSKQISIFVYKETWRKWFMAPELFLNDPVNLEHLENK